MAVKLSTPRYRVILGEPEDPPGWQVLTVQAIGRDMIAAEALFHRRKGWGTPATAAIRFTAVSAYYALRRTGVVEGDWEAFEAVCLEVTSDDDDGDADADGDGGDVVDPTGPDPVPG